jgi:hypothetical protein
MPWTVNTFSGVNTGGQPSNWRIAMFELCRAVNEREVACGGAVTQFRITAGSTVFAPTMEQLELLRFNQAKENLIAIQAAIINMLDGFGLFNNIFFYEDDTFSTKWTVSSMEADIGTDLASNPVSPQDARFWQAMKDALDRMIYINRVHLYSSRWVLLRNATTWEDTIDDTPVGTPFEFVGYQQLTDSTPAGYVIWSDGEYFFSASSFLGVALDAKYQITWGGRGGATPAELLGVFEISVNGDPASYEYGDPVIEEIPADLADVAMNTEFSILVDPVIPATDPFGDSGAVTARIDVIYLIEIASILTDQA